MTRARVAALLTSALAIGASPALAQTPSPHWSPIEVQAVGGARNAVIEGTCSSGDGQAMVGGSIRYHAEGGFGIGAEFLKMRECERQVFTYYHPRSSVMVHMFHDLGRWRARPYLIGGGGYVRHYSGVAPGKTDMEIAGGVGLNIRLPARIVVTPEFQVAGPVLATRFTVGVGFVLW